MGDDWRTRLDRYLDGEPAPLDRPEPTTPLALQFQLRELIPRSADRWNGPTSAAATSTTVGGDYRLGVQPVTRSRTGWAKGNLTWANIVHMRHRLSLDEAQHRWFCQLGAVYRASTPPTAGQENAWVFLDDFANPVLWTFLDQAVELGIPFVGVGSQSTVTRRAQATVTLDLAADDGGLRMTPLVRFDGTEHPPSDARGIARHGVYGWSGAKAGHIELAPTAQTLSAHELELLGDSRTSPEHVRVPADAVSELVAEVLPRLRRQIVVESVDASVPLPALSPPLLLLTATFGPRHALDLAWSWEQGNRGDAHDVDLRSVVGGVLPESWIAGTDGDRETPLDAQLRGDDAAEFAAVVLPQLTTARGVRVRIVGERPDYRELTGTPLITLTPVPTEKYDWFDLGVIVTVDDRTIPFTPLFKALARGRKRLLLSDGGYISLSHPAFGPLRDLINEARDIPEWQTGPRISRHQAAVLEEFEDLADQSPAAAEWRALVADVSRASDGDIALPKGLAADLRPYQAEGFSWLATLWRHRLGAILADDMGLGKTLQCLSLIQHVAESDAAPAPFLVVAPTSVASNWVAEAARFTPELVVRHIRSTEARSPQSIAETARGAHVVVTSYALLRLDSEAYREAGLGGGWRGLILDEAQYVKNPASVIHQSVRDLEVPFVLAVTGTPLENSLTDLHALCTIVAPGLFPSARLFGEQFVQPIEGVAAGISSAQGGDATVETHRTRRLIELRRRLRPFMMRRTKEQVAVELPPKQEQTLMIELNPEHRAAYDLVLQRERQKLFGLLEDMNRNRFTVFRSLTLLRLMALDASLVGEEYADVPSSKLDELLEQVVEAISEGHRMLVFSQFTKYLARAGARLEAAGIPFAYLDGSTRDRDGAIGGFTEGDAPVLLISLKAGGVGLNLTEADYVFLLDPWWNPATEQQAIDRTHRIGQRKNVMVYRLIAADTIEEKVMALQQRKAALFEAVMDDEQLFSQALTPDDIRGLLA